MQTTIIIDDDVLAAAQQLAAQRHQTVGEVISSLTRQALPQPQSAFETRNGVPLLPRTSNSSSVTFDVVEKLQEEQP